ncbi:MAG TPA: hypothetical protein VJ208_03090 [Candidatus Nanoarchaeia archaeon]|nr:hypothetical protein [Candidatus Nanoarchaeia archaeon]
MIKKRARCSLVLGITFAASGFFTVLSSFKITGFVVGSDVSLARFIFAISC